MQLTRGVKLTQGAKELVEISLEYSAAQVLLNASREFFEVRDAGNLVLAGGVISYSMLSDLCYLWLVLDRGEYSFRQRRAGLVCAYNFLRSLPERVMAEVALGDRRSEKFVETLGFVRRKAFDDRTLYEWVN
jgi:hypothetical protein